MTDDQRSTQSTPPTAGIPDYMIAATIIPGSSSPPSSQEGDGSVSPTDQTTAGSSVPEAARAAASDRAVLDRFFARASGRPQRGLADYVQERRREGHRVTLTKDGEYGGCSCGDLMCSTPFWLTWCDQLIRSYGVKVAEFAAETRRSAAAVTAERERADAKYDRLRKDRHLYITTLLRERDAAESELAGLRERIEALEPLFVQPQQPDDNGDRDFALGYNEALREVLRALGSATKTGEGT